ncbi:MAG: hypothetical protein RBS39_12160 [Phycisphaerales bacterium]|jgi:pyrrolidone-carboxylate peptidase|nr:hypothetical protein [Phycisphaerales bacterium]
MRRNGSQAAGWAAKRAAGWAVAAVGGLAPLAVAGHTNNILITGYWPQTNEMVRRYSTSPTQNPDGWIGGNWENRGYDIHSYFPEFPGGVGANPKGNGDLEVDYQDTSADFWRIVEEVRPVAIITFSRGSARANWELERINRNWETWIDDYEAPFQPTDENGVPGRPDKTVPADYIRETSLPVNSIIDAVRATGAIPSSSVFVDETGGGGQFLSEFIAYHGVWYQSMHSDPSDPYWTVAAGHIHVGVNTSLSAAMTATDATLRALTDYLDTVIPAPGTGGVMLAGVGVLARRRRRA